MIALGTSVQTLSVKMFLYQLQNFVDKKIGNKNIYVVPCDLLPSSFKLPAGFIINMSNSKEKGSHWVALSIDSKRHGFYFDSYGFKPQTPDILRFINKHCKSYDYNPKQLQQERSDVCGKYAAMYLLAFFKGVNPEQFVNDFTLNLWQNDRIVSDMFKKYT